MTKIGYEDIKTRIKSQVVDSIPIDLTLPELQAWMNGYGQALADILSVIDELEEGEHYD